MLGQTNAKIVTGGGGSSTKGEYSVRVIDYDGTIIDRQWLDEGEEYTLPETPSHTGLVFQEWSCSQEITSGKVVVGQNHILIGAVYTTTSEQNEFDIELSTPTGLSVTLNMDGTKDWGDGTTDTNTSHTYTDVGKYTIKCNGTTISANLFGQNSSSPNYYVTSVKLVTVSSLRSSCLEYCNSLKSVVLSKTVTALGDSLLQNCKSKFSVVIPSTVSSINSGAFQSMDYLDLVVLPYGLTTISGRAFYNCYNVDTVIPTTVTSIASEVFWDCHKLTNIYVPAISEYCFYKNYSMTKVIFKDTITSFGHSSFSQNACAKIKIPSATTSIGRLVFDYNYQVLEYDFSSCSSVPTLGNVEVFRGINQNCIIKVPLALVDTWKTANYWSSYANYIVGV